MDSRQLLRPRNSLGLRNGERPSGDRARNHFDEVQATDVSAEQISAAFAHPKVAYSVQPAERTNFPVASFDLVAVAQALHWFDLDRFWAEVKRVAKLGSFFCAWGLLLV